MNPDPQVHQIVFPVGYAPHPLRSPFNGIEEQLMIATSEGTSVAFFLPAPAEASETAPHPTVVYFHGNAEIIDYQVEVVRAYHRLGCSVLLPEYRGYGRSEGTPGMQSIMADATAFYDLMLDRADVDPHRIVVHGRSLGGGPATQLAAQRNCAGLILQSTFTGVAAWLSPFGFTPAQASGLFETDSTLPSIECPLLITHGRRDEVIPVQHAWDLHHIKPNATFVEYDCGHNDFPGADNVNDFWQRVEAFLASLS